MLATQTYSSIRYLAAKKSIDDRALNARLWRQFVTRLPVQSDGEALRLLEVGGGIGTMVERFAAAVHCPALDYTLVDADPEHVEAARERLGAWGRRAGYEVTEDEGDALRFQQGNRSLSVTLVCADALAFAEQVRGQRTWHVLIAQAILDLLDVEAALGRLGGLLEPRGLLYLPIHFDGVTALEPVIDEALDAALETHFHASMDATGRGGSRTGRRLIPLLRALGLDVLDAGGSDWVVFPRADGTYADDGAYFLHHLLHFFEEALQGHPDLDPDAFAAWLAERRRQIDAGELVYVAHQLDVLAQRPA